MLIRELDENSKCELAIVIEGPDSVGKHTQALKLAQRLTSERIFGRVGLIEAPIKDIATYDTIYEMLNDGRAKKYPHTFQAIQLLNRLVYQTLGLKYWLRTYDAFVFDRWHASIYAYGRAIGITEDELKCMLDLVALPDLTIVLEGISFPKKVLDDYEADAELQRRVMDYYREWAKKQEHAYIINANRSIDEVHNDIWNVVTSWRAKNYTPDNVIDITRHISVRRLCEHLTQEEDDI